MNVLNIMGVFRGVLRIQTTKWIGCCYDI